MTKEEQRMVDQFRARIEVEAAQRGWSLSQLAAAAGKTPQALNDLMRRGKPGDAVLAELALALGCDVAQLRRPVTELEFGRARIPRRSREEAQADG